MPIKDLKETQLVRLKESTMQAILQEYAQHERDLGKSQTQVMELVSDLVLPMARRLGVPMESNTSMVSAIMRKVYQRVSLREKILTAAVENMVFPTEFDWEDFHVGLPDSISPAVNKVMESVKEADISKEAIVKECGEETVDACLAEVADMFTEAFKQRLRAANSTILR